MLKNDYLVAKIGVDTEENEPRQVCGAVGLASPDLGSLTSLLLSFLPPKPPLPLEFSYEKFEDFVPNMAKSQWF